MESVAAHWGELPPREQKILLMDFRGGMTQTQIGRQLRISQMHVSRLRAHALGYLRSRLLDNATQVSLARASSARRWRAGGPGPPSRTTRPPATPRRDANWAVSRHIRLASPRPVAPAGRGDDAVPHRQVCR